MPLRSPLLIMLAATLAGASALPAHAAPGTGTPAEAENPDLAADRAAILAMAGTFKVRFDMRETTPWRAGYAPIAPAVLGGNEVVRVVADTGRMIMLQHLLVASAGAGKTIVVKHWRQDWTWEPETLLTYAGQGRWTLDPVAPAARRGRWSQTVWQTDDSPRYGGLGRWTTDGGVRHWQSDPTWRPLARRDAVRHPPYDRYLGVNRHAPSPAGWIHWQDNVKMGLVDGALVPFVQETVLNSYARDDGFDARPADAYWAATKDYWAAVRSAWDEVVARRRGVHVAEVAETGSASGERLMGLADEIQAGTLKTAEAVRRARAIIAEVTAG